MEINYVCKNLTLKILYNMSSKILLNVRICSHHICFLVSGINSLLGDWETSIKHPRSLEFLSPKNNPVEEL